MKSKFSKIRTSDFAKNVMKMFTGTIVSQLIAFVSLPFLQKYFYSPEEFATFGAFSRFSELFMTVAVLRLEQGVVLMEKREKLIALFQLIRRVLIWMSVFCALMVIFFNQIIVNLIGEDSIGLYLYIVPVMVFVFGLYQVAYFYLNKEARFGRMARSKVIQVSAAESVKIIGGFFGLSVFGLILGRIAGVLGSFIYVVFPFIKNSKDLNTQIDDRTKKEVFMQNKDFILYSTPSTLSKTLISFLALSLIIYYFGKEKAGNFSVSMQYLGALFALLSVSFSQVYYNKIAQISSRQKLWTYYRNWMLRLFLFSGIAVLVVNIFPQSIVIRFLGDEWVELVPVSKIIVWGMAVSFVSGSLSFIYIRLNKQKQMLIFDVIHVFMICLAIVWGKTFSNTFESVLWFYSIAQVSFYALTITFAFIFIKNSKLLKE